MKKENKTISWGFLARIELVDDEMLLSLKEANCRRIYFGIESGSNRILRYLNRNYTTDYVIDKINKCVKAGILPIAFFMVGMPWENDDDVRHTFNLMKNINSPFIQLSIFTPVIGTPIHTDPATYKVNIYNHSYEEECIDTRYVFIVQRTFMPREFINSGWRVKGSAVHD